MPRLKCPQRKSGVEKKLQKTEKNQKKNLENIIAVREVRREKKKKDCNNDRRFSCVFWRNKLRALWGKKTHLRTESDVENE